MWLSYDNYCTALHQIFPTTTTQGRSPQPSQPFIPSFLTSFVRKLGTVEFYECPYLPAPPPLILPQDNTGRTNALCQECLSTFRSRSVERYLAKQFYGFYPSTTVLARERLVVPFLAVKELYSHHLALKGSEAQCPVNPEQRC